MQHALYQHLGFTPTTNNYLEVRYHSVVARNNTAGSALALRVYRLGADIDTKANTTASAESYAATSVSYPNCRLTFDSVTQVTPVMASEKDAVVAVYPHMSPAESVIVLKMTVSYRHAETPFEDEKRAFYEVVVGEGTDTEGSA